MLNSICIMGRLTSDPELKTTPAQVPVTTFTIEFIQLHFRKGSTIAIEGRLQMRSWKDKDGGRHEQAEILVENVYFGDRKKEEV